MAEQVTKRIRRMTPLERTRVLPAVTIPVEGASYVMVGGEADGTAHPVAWRDLSPELQTNRRMCAAKAETVALDRWLEDAGAGADLVDLLPTLAEAMAAIGRWEPDAYDVLLAAFWAGALSTPLADAEPHLFTLARLEMEALGAAMPPDLPAGGTAYGEGDGSDYETIDIELSLFYLTGVYGLDLTDDEVIDAFNHVQQADHPRMALVEFLIALGKDVTEITE